MQEGRLLEKSRREMTEFAAEIPREKICFDESDLYLELRVFAIFELIFIF